MRKNNKILLGAVITIAACGSVIAGSTYALFTSETKTNIAITAGTVDVATEVSDVKTYSGEWDEETGAYVEKETAEAGKFTNGGTAKVEGSDIVLDKISPMDKITFKLTTKNNSNINVQYRTKIMCEEGADLFAGLEMTLGEETYEGVTSISDWVALTPGSEDDVVEVTIAMPQEAGNKYQGKTTKISIISEAVQGNAKVENPDDSVVAIYTAADLLKVANDVNSNANLYRAMPVELMNDIDMTGVDFPGIGQSVTNYPSYSFQGIFDGKGHTISNLSVDVSDSDDEYQAAGLFGTLDGKVKDVIVDHADIKSCHYAGGIVGYSTANVGMSVTNCTVKNSSIVSTPKLFGGAMDNGDKVGGIIGYCVEGDQVIGCTVEDTTVTAYRDVGGIAGASAATIKDCVVKNSTVVQDNTNAYKTSVDTYHEILGRELEGVTLENNTFENVTVTTK